MGIFDILKSEEKNQEKEIFTQEVSVEETVEDKEQKFRQKLGMLNQETHEPTNDVSPSIEGGKDIFVNRSQHVKITKPKVYDDCKRIGEAIKEGKVVILHMEELDSGTATRILEFVYGICFAFDIEPEEVDSKIFMIDPGHKRR